MAAPTDRSADVVVVGAGPAGSAAAWQLRQAGREVVVLEKAQFPREKVCGDGLTPRGVQALRDLDVDAVARPRAAHAPREGQREVRDVQLPAAHLAQRGQVEEPAEAREVREREVVQVQVPDVQCAAGERAREPVGP